MFSLEIFSTQDCSYTAAKPEHLLCCRGSNHWDTVFYCHHIKRDQNTVHVVRKDKSTKQKTNKPTH